MAGVRRSREEKDLARAPSVPENYGPVSNSVQYPASSSSSYAPSNPSISYSPEFLGPEKDWEVLDTCLNADDMRLVGRAYAFLKDRGLLKNFGKRRNIVVDGTRDVTPTVLKELTGLEASKLAPKKWGLSGTSRILLAAFFGVANVLVSRGIDIRPSLAALLALGTFDAVFLGGSCLTQIFCFWPPYRRRVLVHEAGHLLTAYLMGCPVRGVILDPIVAMQMGIQGQAGTQFWDDKLERELAEGRLSNTAFDRYCMVLLVGLLLKLSFMEKLKVEKTMKICLGVSAFCCSLH
ncbi:hypothetical protein HPP92_005940 [Vanilla planifolia]|uniref:Uncharacterized protein n=1 Tax=Vanilla planifolia TaxID=51239 RepID=A0A835RVG0_VANPL|nr:hypothetical protein HPP92_005940 [Vanilla planifolia]